MDDRIRPAEFEAILEEHQGVGVVLARGELDIGSVRELQAKINEAITECVSARGVVANLTEVEFMESVTLGILVEQRNELRDHDKELALVIQSSSGPEEHPVGRLLHLTGQAGEFRVYDDHSSAVEEMSI